MDAVAGPLALAWHDLHRGRPDRALAALEKATGADLEAYEFWNLRARALFELGRWDEAAAAAESGLEQAPDDGELLDVLALAQLESGRTKEARATIDAAIVLYPDVAELHAHRALILARRADKSFRLASYRKARAAVDEALRLDPTSEAALRVRAQIGVMSNDRRAHEYAEELLALEPDDGRVHVIRGAALAGRGDVSESLRHFDEAARLDPSDPTLAWVGRRSRAMQRPFFAPVLFLERISRGHSRIAWVAVVVASMRAGVPLLTAAVIAFWVYLWVAHAYLRVQTGKQPD
jgi:tetratricopeptide (TPR) repeat protein